MVIYYLDFPAIRQKRMSDCSRFSDLDLVKVLLMSCPRQTSFSSASMQLGHVPARGYCLHDFRFRICDQ